MKTILKVVFGLIFFFLIIENIYSQENGLCLTPEFPQDSLPEYLKENWGMQRSIPIALAFFDFPDGRWNDNGVLKQPLEVRDLYGVENLDAAAEIGLKDSGEDYFKVSTPNGFLFTNPAKYTVYDQWRMYFSEALYYGAVHPDHETHHDMVGYKSTGYGSMFDYWKEVSNNKALIIPALTHSNESDPELRTGIINDYLNDPSGNKIVSYFKLNRKKFGTGGYFTDYYDTNGDVYGLWMDCINYLKNNPTNDFNYDNFINSGGYVVIIIAGGTDGFKGQAGLPSEFRRGTTMVINMEARYNQPGFRLNGISNVAHELGHLLFGFGHALGGRYCLMNAYNRRDLNCPTHPNPIYKLRMGWIDEPIPLENSQNGISLPPIESSNQCGIVTIYGKPTAANDNLSGECYIIENRRRLGFDQLILNESYDDFKGGVLIWHYSPYKEINPGCGVTDGTNAFIKLITPTNVSGPPLCVTTGDPVHFFAYSSGLFSEFYSLPTTRTFSSHNFETGINISNIHQADYGDINSPIYLDLSYLIREPSVYNKVIFPTGLGQRVETLSGMVFNHYRDNNAFYIIEPGTIIEGFPEAPVYVSHFPPIPPQNPFTKNSFKALGEEYAPIVLRGLESYSPSDIGLVNVLPLDLNAPQKFSVVDGILINNVNMKYLNPISSNYILNTQTSNVNIEINNFTRFPTRDHYNTITHFDLIILNSIIFDLNISDLKLKLQSNKFLQETGIQNCYLDFAGINNFHEDGKLTLHNSQMKMLSGSFNFQNSTLYGKGVKINGGRGIQLNNVTINNADKGVEILNPLYFSEVKNCTFNNTAYNDIIVHNTANEIWSNEISGNHFYPNSSFNGSVITCSDAHNIQILNNEINFYEPGGFNGISIYNSLDPLIKNNQIYRCGYSGIDSYNSGGYFECNKIEDCSVYGISLDNSQPVLYNNEISYNGMGIFMTNNSNPIMAPAYLENETYVRGGYNKISFNAAEEIFVHNTGISYCSPYMQSGINSIEDLDPGPAPNILMTSNEVIIGGNPGIRCAENYWGGLSPYGRLYPDYVFSFDPYLESPGTFPCEYTSIMENNSGMNSEDLLMGNYLKSKYTNQNEAALNYATQLLNSSVLINPVISLNNILLMSYLTQQNLFDLENFYLSQAQSHSNDTVYYKKAMNLATATKIYRDELLPAIQDYDNIIQTSSNTEEIFYARMDKYRVLGLLLGDTNSGGDNLVSFNSGELKFENTSTPIVKNIGSKMPSEEIVSNPFGKLKERYNEKIENLSESEISKNINSMLMEKMIIELGEKNFRSDIPKLKHRNRLQQTSPSQALVYKLYQNYPNPFNPLTKITFSLPDEGKVKLIVYDVLGREVANLIKNEIKQPGIHSVEFDGSNLASGAYFYRLEINGQRRFVQIKKMMLIK